MRWPIQIQLLLPMLTVVVLAIVLASGVSAYLGGKRARQVRDENLQRVVATLSEARFPLSTPVLRQMSGLSGAEFVFFQGGEVPRASTLQLNRDDLKLLRGLSYAKGPDIFEAEHTTLLSGRIYLSQGVPVRTREPASPNGSLIVLYPEDRWWSAVHQAAYPALMTGAVAVMAVILVTTYLAHRFVNPIRQLGNQAVAISQGDFKPVSVPNRNDEIRDLTLSINQMAQRLGQYENDVRRNEQLRTLGKLGAGMAHQLRNAATGGLMAIELHKRRCPAVADQESLDVALRQLHLMESYLQRFLTLGQERSIAFETVSLGAVVEDALELVRPACIHAGIELIYTKSPAAILLRADPDALRQLTVNLALNAVEAAGRQKDQKAKIAVDVAPLGRDRGALHIRDSGPGPDADVAQRLFEPFVSGKPEGTGLGLYVARQVAESHQGLIRWQREDNMTCFTVEFPLTEN
jgi:signal transduction histidine kinase